MADDDNTRSYRSGAPLPRGGSPDNAGEQGQGGDPLAELARLIGQQDPFANFGHGAASRDPHPAPLASLPPVPDWRSSREDDQGVDHGQSGDAGRDDYQTDYPAEDYLQRNQPRRDDRSQDYSRQDYPRQHEAEQDYAARDYAALGEPPILPEPYLGFPRREAQVRDEPRYDDENVAALSAGHDERPYSQDSFRVQGYEDAAYTRQANDMYDEGMPAARGRGGLFTVAAVLALAVVGTAGAFAYRAYFGGAASPPPVIRADGAPNKIVPATQSTDSASSKLLQDRMADRGPGERMVSREEQPIQLNAAPRALTPRAEAPGAAQPGLPANVSALAVSGANEPKKIRTVTIRPDQPAGDPLAQRADQAARAPAQRSPAASTAPAPARNVTGPISLNPQTGQVSPPAAAPRMAAAPPIPSPARGPASGSGYFVQLSAQRSPGEAETSFQTLQAKFPNLLGSRQATIRRKQVAGKGTFYGAQVGPFGSRDEASNLCEGLKSQGGSCMVERN
jgi:hypothetical protein